jgi:hypothetical protein
MQPGRRRGRQGDLSQALGYTWRRKTHGRSDNKVKSGFVMLHDSNTSNIVIYPMEAVLRLGTRDKVGYRSLVVTMKARAEPNQPAAGCR